jgi:hypothetical protein
VFRGLALVVGVLALLGAGLPATAADGPVPAVAGWTITHGSDPAVCFAEGPSDGQATLSLATAGPLFFVIVGAPDFPREKASYTAMLSFDGGPPVSAVALGENGTLSISTGDEPVRIIAASSRVSVTVDGHTHSFSLRNAAAALDGAAHCAGQQALAQRPNQPPVAIAGAGSWTLLVTMAGVPGRACSARNPGAEIDTILTLNNDGDLILIGGHRDWATWGGDAPLQLSIDGETPIKMQAQTINNLILTLVKDPGVIARLRRAKTLDWTIPTGHVRGEVTGLGLAIDAMKACKAGR